MSHTRFGFQARNTPAERRAFFDLIRTDHRTGRDMETVIDALEELEVQGPFDVTFQGTWVNHDAAGGRDVEYWKIGRMVYLQGVMKSGTPGTAAFTLPTGFRPPKGRTFIIAHSSTGVSTVPGQLDVASTGTVTPASGVGPNWVFLDGVSFLVDA